MSSFDYSGLQTTAQRLIQRFGRSATLKRSANTGTAYAPTQTVTSYSVTVAIFDFKTAQVDGVNVMMGDKKAYVSALGLAITPVSGDVLTIGGVDHRVVSVMTTEPGATTIYFELQVRR